MQACSCDRGPKGLTLTTLMLILSSSIFSAKASHVGCSRWHHVHQGAYCRPQHPHGSQTLDTHAIRPKENRLDPIASECVRFFNGLTACMATLQGYIYQRLHVLTKLTKVYSCACT